MKARFLKIVKNPFIIFTYAIRLWMKIIIALPYFKFIRDTKGTDVEISFRTWFLQKVLRFNHYAYWPMHHASIVSYAKNIHLGALTFPGINPGCYIHAVNKIYIGDFTQFGPNVGLMSGNHSFYDYREQLEAPPIKIGKCCWIGMGVVILPGVELGDFTIVGAGAIVTKSFPEGHCVIAGNPARKLKELEKEKCIVPTIGKLYHGYIAAHKFESYRTKNLTV